MTWYHLIVGGTHYIFPQDSILYLYSNATDGTQSIFLQLVGNVTFEITAAQAIKIIGAVPAPL